MVKLSLIMTFFLLYLFATISSVSAQESCMNAVKNSFLTITNFNYQNVTNPILSMGSNLNDLGNYDQCLHNRLNIYLLLQVIYEQGEQKIPFFLGMCLNKEECDNENSKQMIINFTSSKSGIPPKNIKVINSEKTNQVYWSTDAFTWIVIIFVVLYIFVLSSGAIQITIKYYSGWSGVEQKELQNEQNSKKRCFYK